MSPFKTALCAIVAALAATIIVPWGTEAAAAEPRRVVVEIRKFKFVPETLVLRPGDVVVWKNMDIVPHTATAKDERWDSGEIAAGGEWETRVSAAMQGPYFCLFHPSMVATIEIESK